MGMRSPPDCSALSSPFSSPNVAALLKIKIHSWSQETGFPVCVCVRIGDRIFNLHKHPFTCKSGYFREKLKDSNEVELPPNFPGGPETFEMIALFIYGSSTLVDPINVASLRCAAEFLHMTDEHGTVNLCERFDIYLNQVVLQSWDDTLIVLQKCQTLLPWAEDLLIVSRCIETLAFMACMEILDPERRRNHPVITMEALAATPWSDDMVNDVVSQDLWIKDLVALPFSFFKRVISSLRRQGMKEKYVGPIVLFFAHKWAILNNSSTILQGVIDLLPVRVKATSTIPVGFYFTLLAKSIEFGLRNECLEKLQCHIASMLYLAKLDDFLEAKDAFELCVMESIFSKYFSSTPTGNNYMVAELWDVYLNRIACDKDMGCKRFMSLVQIVPISSRQTHDHLYRTLNTFLQSHKDLSPDEKEMVCKYINCQKLSEEVCVEAVQNEVMPLRLIVQALFVQQLHTQQAFKECSDSFRYTNHSEDFSGSISSSIYANSRSQHLSEQSPYMNGSRPLKTTISREICGRKDYVESTSFRIQNLEKEVVSLKRSLELQKKKENVEIYRKKKKGNGEVRNCIGSVSFGLQRKYANRLVKMLQRISLFGRSKGKGE